MDPGAPLPPSRGRALLAIAVVVALLGGVIAYRVATHEPEPSGAPDRPFPIDFGLPDDIASIQECFIDPVAGLAGDPGDDPSEQIDVVAGDVERIRELEFTSVPEPEFVSQSEVTSRVRDLLLEEYSAEDADADARILTSLGAIEEGTDLRELLSETLGAQVVGFYVPETDELVVGSSGPLGPVERITLAHELEHALADQAFGFPSDEEVRALDDDAALAFTSLAEGDATVTQNRYTVSALSLEDQVTASFEAIALAGENPSGVPHVIARQLTFPYVEGMAFVCDLYTTGGWDAVDGAYENPPTTSAQVLFPDRFRAGEGAVDPPDPGRLSRPWESDPIRSFGAADLLWLFEAPGDAGERALDDPAGRAAAWAGGEIQLWTRGSRSAVGISLVQERGADLCGSIESWFEAAFPGSELAVTPGFVGFQSQGSGPAVKLLCENSLVRMGIAEDFQTAGGLVDLPVE